MPADIKGLQGQEVEEEEARKGRVAGGGSRPGPHHLTAVLPLCPPPGLFETVVVALSLTPDRAEEETTRKLLDATKDVDLLLLLEQALRCGTHSPSASRVCKQPTSITSTVLTPPPCLPLSFSLATQGHVLHDVPAGPQLHHPPAALQARHQDRMGAAQAQSVGQVSRCSALLPSPPAHIPPDASRASRSALPCLLVCRDCFSPLSLAEPCRSSSAPPPRTSPPSW